MIFNYAVAAPVRVHAAGLYGYIYIHVKRGTVSLGPDKTSPSLVIRPV